MATVAEFLAGGPIECKPEKASDMVTLEAVVTGADERAIEFLHFGRQFSVLQGDVLDIANHPHPSGPIPAGGRPVILTMKSSALLQWIQPLTASELSNAVPFAFALPPIRAQLTAVHTPATAEWMGKVGYAAPSDVTPPPTTGSTCICTTKPDDRTDDTKWDDW